MAEAKKRRPARAVAMDRGDNDFWIDHAYIAESDFEWLQFAQRLTLWNVLIPPRFIARLSKLWWFDVRGGSGTDLEAVRDANALRYLAVNQVRGMCDLSVAATLPALEYLDVYGLPKVIGFPSFLTSYKLEHVSLGQLGRLTSLAGVLDAPNLRQLQLIRKLMVNPLDVERIRCHPSLQQFGWLAEDVPNNVWGPVVKAVTLPAVPVLFPSDWFKMKDTTA